MGTWVILVQVGVGTDPCRRTEFLFETFVSNFFVAKIIDTGVSNVEADDKAVAESKTVAETKTSGSRKRTESDSAEK